MDTLFLVMQVLALAVGLHRLYKGWLRRKDFLRAHPAVGYVAPQEGDAWRWSPPPEAFRLFKEERGPVSRLYLPETSRAANIVGSLVGYAMILAGAALCFWAFLLTKDDALGCGRFFLGLCALAGGRGMLDLDARLVAIELERDRAVFVVRYGISLHHHIALPRKPWAQVTGKVQGFWSTEDPEETPEFVLSVPRRLHTKRLPVHCNPSAGSWIVGGLENWMKAEAAVPGFKLW
jgi:hypothetical protein